MQRAVFLACLFDFQSHPPNRRLWQFRLMVLPLLITVVVLMYLDFFFEDLLKYFVVTLATTTESAEKHLYYRMKTVSFSAVAIFLSLIVNRIYLTSFTIAFVVLGVGQFYDYWGRLMLDRSLMSQLQNYEIDYLFMVATVGIVLRVTFLATLGYGAWVTLKKNMDLMAAKPL